MKNILIYLVIFFAVWLFRVSYIGFKLEDSLAVLFYTSPVILFLVGLELSNRQKQKVQKLKSQIVVNFQERVLQIPNELRYKISKSGFLFVSNFALVMFQLISFSFALMVAISEPKIANVYNYTWFGTIILFVLWIIFYTIKSPSVFINNSNLVFKNTNFFLQTKISEFQLNQIASFVKFKVDENWSSSYKNRFDYGLGLYTKDGSFELFPLGIAESELKVEQIMSDLHAFKVKNNLNFEVKNDQWQATISSRTKRLFKNTSQIVVLILLYFFLPLIVATISGLFLKK